MVISFPLQAKPIDFETQISLRTIVPPNISPPKSSRGGVLWISSDGDDRRIFLGSKFSIQGFFWVRKLGKYYFG